jgi:hypothetical protein
VTAAGVSEFDAKLLMNHAIPAVNAGYSPSTSFSRIIFAAGNLPHRIRDWLERDGSQRLALAADVDQNHSQRPSQQTARLPEQYVAA